METGPGRAGLDGGSGNCSSCGSIGHCLAPHTGKESLVTASLPSKCYETEVTWWEWAGLGVLSLSSRDIYP